MLTQRQGVTAVLLVTGGVAAAMIAWVASAESGSVSVTDLEAAAQGSDPSETTTDVTRWDHLDEDLPPPPDMMSGGVDEDPEGMPGLAEDGFVMPCADAADWMGGPLPNLPHVPDELTQVLCHVQTEELVGQAANSALPSVPPTDQWFAVTRVYAPSGIDVGDAGVYGLWETGAVTASVTVMPGWGDEALDILDLAAPANSALAKTHRQVLAGGQLAVIHYPTPERPHVYWRQAQPYGIASASVTGRYLPSQLAEMAEHLTWTMD